MCAAPTVRIFIRWEQFSDDAAWLALRCQSFFFLSCETLQNAWIEVMRKCFPALITKIDQFRFKHSRSEDGNKEENLVDADDETFTRGRRKNSSRVGGIVGLINHFGYRTNTAHFVGVFCNS